MKVLLIVALLLMGSMELKSDDADPRFAPFVALLTLPKDWSGSSVISSGFLVKGPKSGFLFLSSNDAKFNFIENALVLEATTSFRAEYLQKLDQLDGQYVKVFGEFVVYGESSPTRGMIRVQAMVPGLGSFDASIFKATQREIESAP